MRGDATGKECSAGQGESQVASHDWDKLNKAKSPFATGFRALIDSLIRIAKQLVLQSEKREILLHLIVV